MSQSSLQLCFLVPVPESELTHFNIEWTKYVHSMYVHMYVAETENGYKHAHMHWFDNWKELYASAFEPIILVYSMAALNCC
jgi:hypothetical protein